MSITDKYELETIGYGTTGWNALLTTLIEKIEEFLPTRILGTLTEAGTAYTAVYQDGSDYSLALADGTQYPAVGLLVEDGDAEDTVRIHVMGPIENEAWAFTPGPVYLDGSTPGVLTQVKPATYAQFIGFAVSATLLLVCPQMNVAVPEMPAATAANDFVVAGTDPFNWTKKTLAETKAVLGVPTGTAENDFIMAGADPFTWAKKTLTEVRVVLGMKFSVGLSADGAWCGVSIPGTLGDTVAFGEVCYYNSATDKWLKAKADVAATSRHDLGYCVIAGGDTDASEFLQFGVIRADAVFPELTAGPVYLSAATAGAVTSTAPSGTEDFVIRKVGLQRTANEVKVIISPDYITLLAPEA